MRSKLALLLFAVPLLWVSAATESGQASSQHWPWSGWWWPVNDNNDPNLYDANGSWTPMIDWENYSHRGGAWYWEHTTQGHRPDASSWMGHCHAWAMASDREVEPWTASGRQPFNIGDQKGLLTECYYGVGYVPDYKYPSYLPMYPGDLWYALHELTYGNGYCTIVDISLGTPVFNYPCYSYSITYDPLGQDGDYQCTATLDFADDAVGAEYVGPIQNLEKVYTFVVPLTSGTPPPAQRSGYWTGASVNDHPDVAWYTMDRREYAPGTDAPNPYVADAAGYDLVWSIIHTGTGVSEGPHSVAVGTLALSASPNPCSRDTRVKFTVPTNCVGGATLRVYDHVGKLVRSLLRTNRLNGPRELDFDGRDDRGRALPAGEYFLKLESQAGSRIAGVVLLSEGRE